MTTSLCQGGNIVVISDSVSLNQTGVHRDTFFFYLLGNASLWNTLVLSPCRAVSPFSETFLGTFYITLPGGREIYKWMFPLFCPANHVNHLIFEYKQTPHVGCLLFSNTQTLVTVESRCLWIFTWQRMQVLVSWRHRLRTGSQFIS